MGGYFWIKGQSIRSITLPGMLENDSVWYSNMNCTCCFKWHTFTVGVCCEENKVEVTKHP